MALQLAFEMCKSGVRMVSGICCAGGEIWATFLSAKAHSSCAREAGIGVDQDDRHSASCARLPMLVRLCLEPLRASASAHASARPPSNRSHGGGEGETGATQDLR